jgi:hypothetical protein
MNLFLLDHLTYVSGQGQTQSDHQKLHPGTKNN